MGRGRPVKYVDPYSRNRHSCYLLKYHLVVVTKYRKPVLSEAVTARLYEIINDLFEGDYGCKVISAKVDGQTKDHLHILFEAPPDPALKVD